MFHIMLYYQTYIQAASASSTVQHFIILKASGIQPQWVWDITCYDGIGINKVSAIRNVTKAEWMKMYGAKCRSFIADGALTFLLSKL